jgi:hypothetical protein
MKSSESWLMFRCVYVVLGYDECEGGCFKIHFHAVLRISLLKRLLVFLNLTTMAYYIFLNVFHCCRLTLACGGIALNSFDDLNPDCLGHAELVYEYTLVSVFFLRQIVFCLSVVE